MKKVFVLTLFCFFAFGLSMHAQTLILNDGIQEVRIGLVNQEAYDSFVAQDGPHYRLSLTDITYIVYPGYSFYGEDVLNTLGTSNEILIFDDYGQVSNTIDQNSDIEIDGTPAGGKTGTISSSSDIEIL